jgi:hypothetical protein
MPMTSSRRQERSDDEIRSMISPSQSTCTGGSLAEARVDSCYGRGGGLLLAHDTLFGMPLFFERLHQGRKRRKMGNTSQRDDPRRQGPGPDGNTPATTTARRQQRWTRPANIDTTTCHVATTAPAAPRPPPAPRNAHVMSKLARESPCSVVPNHCITRKAFTFV